MASPVRSGSGASTPPETGEPGKRSDPGLLEREAQLRLLESLLDDVRCGNGGFAVVEGPAGIGKTALLQAARSMAERSGLSVLSARGTEMERDFAFGIVRQLFEPPLSAAAAEDRASLLSGAAGAAGAVLGPDERNVPPADLGALGPADASFTTLHGLYWLSSNLCDRAPLMFAIDDAHWVDPASRRFLRFILPRLAELPLLLLIAVRSEELLGSEALDAILADPLTRQIRLEPLSEAAVRALADAADAKLAADAARACHQATGGNPFLVEELLRDLKARGQPGSPPSAELVRSAPTSVTRSVSLRLAALDEGAGALASATAILGDDVDPRLAAELARLDLDDAARHADSLRTAGLLRPGRRLSFLHPLVRGAVYARITPAERAAAHARSAVLLKEAGADLAVVAVHLLGAEPAGNPGVVEGLREGARTALARGAPETASRYLRRALAEPPLEGDRAQLLFELGSACVMAGEPEAAARLTDALGLARNPELRAAIALELGAQTLYEGRVGEAAQLLERELEILGGADAKLTAQLESELLITGVTTASARRAVRERYREARERLEAMAPEQARLLLPCLAVDLAIEGGAADQVATLARRGLEAGPFGIERGGWVLAAITVHALVAAGRASEGETAASEAIAIARERGSAYGVSLASVLRSFARLRRGALDGAESDATTSLELAGQIGSGVFHSWALALTVSILVERGEAASARAALDAGRESDAIEEDTYLDPYLHEATAGLLMLEGKPDEALEQLRACERFEAEFAGAPTIVPVAWRSRAATTHLALGHVDEARRLADEELELAHRFGTPRQIGVALRAAGLIEGGDRGVELLAEAGSALEEAEDRLEHSRALVDLGAGLRRANRRSAAREHLHRGVELAACCGAVALINRARVELLAAGASPRRPRGSGPDALTPSERRTCELARDGLSNSEIAQQLFVTKKTVEYHLSNAYRKLGISSRADITTALSAPRGPT